MSGGVQIIEPWKARRLSGGALGTFIDRIIAPFAPAAALRRVRQREAIEALAIYGAAIKNRLNADWIAPATYADQALGDIPLMNARARQSVRDDAYSKSAVNAYRRHIVSCGITPSANARDPFTGEELPEFNAPANKWFYIWAENPEYCDQEGKKTFVMTQDLSVSEMVTVGEALVLMNYVPDREMVGLRLQMIEPEQIDTLPTFNRDTGNRVNGGVEIDKYGRPVAHYLYTDQHPLETGYGGYVWRRGQSERVLADRVIHLMRHDRVRQSRGYTWLSPVLQDLRDLKQYDDYTMIAAKFEACLCGILVEDPTAASAAGDPMSLIGSTTGGTETDTRGNEKIRLEPGTVQRVSAAGGGDVKFLVPQRPGNLYEPFSKTKISKIAAGADLDYPTVSRDFSGNTYAGQREGKNERDAALDPIQLLMIAALCRRVWNRFQEIAIQEGRYPAPHFFDSVPWRHAYLACNWRGSPKRPIDPEKEANAQKTRLETGMETLDGAWNETNGGDWRDGMRQRADEERFCVEQDPPVDLPHFHPASGASAPPKGAE